MERPSYQGLRHLLQTLHLASLHPHNLGRWVQVTAHYTDGNTKAQRDPVTCPRPHTQQPCGSGRTNPGSLALSLAPSLPPRGIPGAGAGVVGAGNSAPRAVPGFLEQPPRTSTSPRCCRPPLRAPAPSLSSITSLLSQDQKQLQGSLARRISKLVTKTIFKKLNAMYSRLQKT